MSIQDILKLAACIYAIMRFMDHLEQFIHHAWKRYIGYSVEKSSGIISITLRDLQTGTPYDITFSDLTEYKAFIKDHQTTFTKIKKEVKEEIDLDDLEE